MNIKGLPSTLAVVCCLGCTGETRETAAITPSMSVAAAPAPEVQAAPIASNCVPNGASNCAAPEVTQTQPPSEPIGTPGASMPPSDASAVASAPVPLQAPSTVEPLPTDAAGAPSAPAEAQPSSTPSASIAPAGSDTIAPAAADADGFQLMWEDQFDTLDTARWAAQTHTWDGNLAQFSPDNVAAVDGRLQISLTPSGDTDKPYHGVEYRSLETITYGKVEASMRFAKGSGVVSSLVLIYTPWPPDDWNELDIECLGSTTGEVQFNHMVNIPPADPATEHLQFPELVDLGFDPTTDFHTYTIEWRPTSVRFLVDGVVVHEPTEEISRLVLPQNILLTIWASDSADWAGPIDETTAPTFAEVDWLRVYSYASADTSVQPPN